ncbi:LytTR family DNA-binding domain-containing protein [Arenibacter sp. F26102]|uniref:LytR/AlgR family response regulator transcription factor n=1 Tax=Arenibacter sp. F26102 TaxID=2926416 RepID=UPI001FF4C4E7|nr:LytTR family DNA-binding domain-containing protein [Arenibacter sp. F26102]MCK0146228.1 LytTR family DNA-binding domain-containing protein [Arenibacter sp. F26102]
MGTIKCLIVDDEELARSLLKTYVAKVNFLELVADFENPLDAIKVLKEQKIDLLLLDIQMPEIKGTEFAKMISPDTQVIFTTAYSEYALEGFELNAIDYLLKPITFERFLKAVNKIKTDTEQDTSEDTIIVKSGYDLHKIKFDSILYIESDSEYVIYHTLQGKIMSNQSLTALEKRLPKELFMRVHRSYIVNKKKVSALKGKDVFIEKVAIPVSASYFDSVKSNLF